MSESGGYGRVTVSWGDPSDADGHVVSFASMPSVERLTAVVPLDGSHVVRLHPDGSGELLRLDDEELRESD